MAQRDLVASLRAYKRAEDRLKAAREDLERAIATALNNGEWQVIDVAELTGWSRETVRAIRDKVNKADAGASSDS
jgi:DNA-binding NtrC family response regulator